MLNIYNSYEEMTSQLTEEEILAKVNQFHRERNKRMELNKDYQKRQRTMVKEMAARLAAYEQNKEVAA